MHIDLTISDPRWSALSLKQLAGNAASAVGAHSGLPENTCEISLLACSDAEITRLNTDFRNKNKATNVLSWPANDLAGPTPGSEPRPPVADYTGDIPLGDIAIAWETCAREAQAAGREMQHHVTHLLVHGVLHLLGYDHIRDADATLMMKNEVEILGKLGIDNPY